MKVRVRPPAILRPDGGCRVALYPGSASSPQVTEWIRTRNWTALIGAGVRWYDPRHGRWRATWDEAMMGRAE